MTAPTPHEQAAEVLARSLYEEQRAFIRADDPMIALVGVPWDQAPAIVREHWRSTVAPMAEALVAAGLLPDREEWGVRWGNQVEALPKDRVEFWTGTEHGREVGRIAVRRYVTEWRTADE